MSAIIFDSWEAKNQSRRYPLAEDAGDVFPVNILADLKVLIPNSWGQEQVYISSLVVKKSIISFSISYIDKVVAWAFGNSSQTKSLESSELSGSVTFGIVGVDTELNLTLTQAQGRLAFGVAQKSNVVGAKISAGAATFVGDVQLFGSKGIVVSTDTITIDGVEKRAIRLNISNALNRAAIPDCAVQPEEYWARQGRLGIVSINGVYADDSGNFVLLAQGAGSVDPVTGGFLTTLLIDRDDICQKTWVPKDTKPVCDT